MVPPPTPAPVLETWLTHLSLTQRCQFYHINSAHIYPFLYTPTAKALVKVLISSYLGYSNGLITDLPASSFVLPVYFHFHTFTHEASFGWDYVLSSHSLQIPTPQWTSSSPKCLAELTVQHPGSDLNLGFPDSKVHALNCSCSTAFSYNKDILKSSEFFFLNTILFYLWLCWVFVSVRGLSPVVASGGHSASRCAGPLIIAASPDAQAQ